MTRSSESPTKLGDLDTAKEIIDEDHALVRFYLPAGEPLARIALKTIGLGEALTDAVRAVSRQNPRLQGVIDTVDFNATTAGQPIVDNDRLAALVEVAWAASSRTSRRSAGPSWDRLRVPCFGSLLKVRARALGSSIPLPEVGRIDGANSRSPARNDGLRPLLWFFRASDQVPSATVGDSRECQ